MDEKEQEEIINIRMWVFFLVGMLICMVIANSFLIIENGKLAARQEEIIAKHNNFVDYTYDKMNKTENRLERDEKYIATLYSYRAYDAVQGKEIDGNASGRIVTNIGTWG